MADITAHNFSGEYSGLLSTFWVFLGVGGVCIISHEILTRVPRRRGRDGPIGGKSLFKLRRKGKAAWTGQADEKGRWKARLHGGGGGARLKGEEVHEMKEKGEGAQAVEVKRDINDPVWRAQQVRKVLGSRESWEFKYLYEARAWNRISPAEPILRWPLMWIWQTLAYKDDDLPERIGIDCAVHIRFLRACCWYAALHCCTTLVVLLPIHFKYALPDIASSSMLRAGVTVNTDADYAKYLWVHVFLLWYMIITWIIAVWWVLRGGLRMREQEIQKTINDLDFRGRTAKLDVDGFPIDDAKETSKLMPAGSVVVVPPSPVDPTPARDSEASAAGTMVNPASDAKDRKDMDAKDEKDMDKSDAESKFADPALELSVQPSLAAGLAQYRTVLVSNIPPSMRSVPVLQAYFDHGLSQPEPKHALEPFQKDPTGYILRHIKRHGAALASPTATSHLPKLKLHKRKGKDSIGEVLADPTTADPRVATPAADEEQGQVVEVPIMVEAESKVEEIVLVRKLEELHILRERREKIRKRLELAHLRLAERVIRAVEKAMTSEKSRKGQLPRADTEKQALSGEDKATRDLQRLIDVTRPFTRAGQGEETPFATIWDALDDLRAKGLLDPYQALTRTKLHLRKADAPLIDLLTAKYQHLGRLIQEKRSQPIDSYRAASSAFVTFKDAHSYQRALRDLSSHPHHVLSCRIRPAPQHTDIIWPKLVKSIYRAEAVKSWVIALVVWVITILWVFPITLLAGVASANTAARVIPALDRYLIAHPKLSAQLDTLIPVILVGLITLSVCPILLAISNHEAHIVTGYGVHDATLSRYWKWLVFNLLIVFSVGKAALQSYVFAKINVSQVLNQVASAFPAAAPYYAGAIMYNTAIQVFLELLRLGLPLIAYVFARRKAVIPRQRQEDQRTVSWFFLVPNHLFTLILINEFTIFNPLLLPFGLVYFVAARIVYARNFTHSYGRRYENSAKRNGRRYLRYSLDGFILAEFSWLAFMILSKQKVAAGFAGALIPLTVFVKVILTRVIRAKHARISAWQADEMARMNQKIEDRKPYLLQPASIEDNDDHSDAVTISHPAFLRWFDVPVIEKTMPYRRQPLYHDKVEDWLWLPRDPLSTLDLDDTVQFHSFLVTTHSSGLLRARSHPSQETASINSNDSASPSIGAAVDDNADARDESAWANIVGTLSIRRKSKSRHPSDDQPDEGLQSTPTRSSTRFQSLRHSVDGSTDLQTSPTARRRQGSQHLTPARNPLPRRQSSASVSEAIAREIKQEEEEELARVRKQEKKEADAEMQEQSKSLASQRWKKASLVVRMSPRVQGQSQDEAD